MKIKFYICSLLLIASQLSSVFGLEKIHVQLKWKHQFQFAGYYAAIKQGYYRDKGLEVILHETSPSQTSIIPLLKNEVQYAVDMPSAFIVSHKTNKIVALAAIFQHSPVALYSLKSKNIKTIHDIIGKKIMLPQRINSEIRAMFISEGLSLADLKIMPLEWGIDVLINKKADIVSGYTTDMPYLFTRQGLEYNEIRAVDYGLDFYGDCLFTSNKELRNHPKRVKDFLEASLAGWRYAMSHQEEMIAYILSNYSQRLSADTLRYEAQAMEQLILPRQIEMGHMNNLRWKFMAETFLSLGLISSNYNLQEFIYRPETSPNRWIFYILLGLFTGGLLVFLISWFWNRQLSLSVKKALLDRKKSEQDYREIFNSTSDAIFIHDARDGSILDVNQSMLEMYGYDNIEQVKSPQFLEENFCGSPYDMDHVLDYMRKTIEEGPQLFDWCTRKRNGQEFWVEVSLKLTRTNDRDIILAVVRDVSDRKSNEKAIKDSEEKYMTVFNATDSAVFIHDAKSGDILEVNESMLKMYGYDSPDEVLGNKILVLSSGNPGFTSEDAAHNLELCINEGRQVFEWQARGRQGNVFWVEVTLKYYTSNNEGRVLAVVRNIEEKKRMEQARLHNLKIMESFIDSLPGLAMLLDKDLKVVLINDAMCQSLGCKAEELISTDLSSIIPAHILQEREKQVRKVFETQQPLQWEDEREGRHFYNFVTPILNEDKKVESTAIFTLDITQRKIFEKYNTRLATALEQSAEAISIITREGMVEYINSAFEEILGFKKDAIIGKPPFHILKHVWDEKTALTPEQSMQSNMVWQGMIRHKSESGSYLELNTSITPIYKSGELMGWVTIQRDETLLRKLSADLRQSQKMEAIGTLAGGIAHDFNNILMGIMGYTEMAQMVTKDNPQLKDYLSQVYQSAIRAKELVEQILAFSRKSDYTKRVVQLKTLVQEAVKLLRSSIPSTISINTDIHSDKSIVANSTQIHQIIMNLCTNAYHAMPEGGELTISVGEVAPDKLQDLIKIKTDAKSYLQLKIKDTGKGISDIIIDRIFEPYFTTKSKGKGTGMGLAVVQGIVKNHDGFIDVKSVINQGTEFMVYFPAIETVPEATQKIEDSKEETENQYNILFIDDEVTIVNLVQQYLESRGYSVTTFSDSSEAEKEIASHLDSYDVVISDVTMPYLTGIDLLRLIHKIDPLKAVILCSGNASVIEDEASDCLFLEKPMNLSELEKMIKQSMKK